MKKSKKVSDLEVIESYFTTGNKHRDKYYFKIYKEAEQAQIFESLLTPLLLIDKIASYCYAGRKKPLQTVKQVKQVIEDEGLNYKQNCFVYGHLIKFIDNTVWKDESDNDVRLEQIKDLLDNEFTASMPEKVQKVENHNSLDKIKQHLEL